MPLQANACFLGDVVRQIAGIDFGLFLIEGLGLFGGHVADLDQGARSVLVERLIADDGGKAFVHGGDDGIIHGVGGGQEEELREHEVLIALLGERGGVKAFDALLAEDAQASELVGGQVVAHEAGLGVDDVKALAEQLGDLGGGGAGVNDIELDARGILESKGMQVREVAGLGGEGDLARMLLHVLDHAGQVGELLILGVDEEGAGVIHEGHARQLEVLDDVEVSVQAHQLGDGGAGVEEHEAVAIVGVVEHILKGHGAGAAGHVGDDDVPAELFGQRGSQCAGIGVGVPAGIRRHDQFDGAFRPLSQGGDAAEKQHQGEDCTEKFFHLDVPPCDFVWKVQSPLGLGL